MKAGKRIARGFFEFDIGIGPADTNGYRPYCYSINGGGAFEVSYTIDQYLNAIFFDGMPDDDVKYFIVEALGNKHASR